MCEDAHWADGITCGTVADAMTGQAVRASCVVLSVEGSLARLRLVRPEARNAINDEMVRGLAVGLDQLERSGARCLLLSAEGEHFTVGGDLDDLAATVDRLPHELAEVMPAYHDVLLRLDALELPVVCAAQGVVAGGGLGLLWVCDVVIAAADLRLATGFAGLGLSGDGGSSWALPRLIGERRARALMLAGRKLDAQVALEWGLVDRVVERERLEAEAEAQAASLARGPSIAFAHIKRLLRASRGNRLPDQLAAEQAAMIECAGTEDARVGILGFAEHRRPEFQGG